MSTTTIFMVDSPSTSNCHDGTLGLWRPAVPNCTYEDSPGVGTWFPPSGGATGDPDYLPRAFSTCPMKRRRSNSHLLRTGATSILGDLTSSEDGVSKSVLAGGA